MVKPQKREMNVDAIPPTTVSRKTLNDVIKICSKNEKNTDHTLRGGGVGQSSSQGVTDEHQRGHVQALEEPVPEELGGDIAVVEAHNPEVRDQKEHRGEDEVGNLAEEDQRKLGLYF